ncbi:MAG: electron transport complex subunit RsxC [Spirochaetales bacterium]
MNRIIRLPRGGLFLPSRKDNLRHSPVRNASLPPLAIVPLVRADGQEISPLVQVGDKVHEGMPIGKGKGTYSSYIHAPIPGTVWDIRKIPLPIGIEAMAVFIELGGAFDRLGKKDVVFPWNGIPHRELKNQLMEKGVLDPDFPMDGPIEILIINGMELEPYLSATYRILVERSNEILQGVRILQKLLEPDRTIVVLEATASEAQAALKGALQFEPVQREGENDRGIDLVSVEGKYPVDSKDQLIRIFSHRHSMPGNPGASPDIVVVDVSTTFAVYEGVALRKPWMERVITIGGNAIRHPANLKVRIGTPIVDLIEECGGLVESPVKVVSGGPLRGSGVFDLRTPVTKDTSGILFLSREEIHSGVQTPCINCGKCIQVCPEGLHPAKLFKWIDHGLFEKALEESLLNCTECGCCAFVCPSRIPLVQGLQVGKYHMDGKMNEKGRKETSRG